SVLARNWWWPRGEPLTASWLVKARIEPTAPASCPILECAGPWTRPALARSRTYSSNVRISTSWFNIAVSSAGSAASQSSVVATSSTHGAAAVSCLCWLMTRLKLGLPTPSLPQDGIQSLVQIEYRFRFTAPLMPIYDVLDPFHSGWERRR